MFRSVGDTPGDHGAAIGSVQEPVISSAIGKIKTAIGSVTIARANAIVAQPAVGDLVYEGDLIETGIDGLVGIVFVDGTTFHLYASARMVLDEFIYGAEKSSHSALLRVVKGMFGFIAGKMATTGRLIIDTPLAKIRNTPTPAITGGLTFSLFVFCLIREAEAFFLDLSVLENGKILSKDQKFGIIEFLTTDGQILVANDPDDLIVIKTGVGGTTLVSHQTITSSLRAELQGGYQAAVATLVAGQAALKALQDQDHAAAQGNGSGTTIFASNNELLLTTSLTTTTSTGPQGTGTGTGSGTGGGGGSDIPTPIYSAVIKTLPITNDQPGPVYLGGLEPVPSQVSNPNVALTVTVVSTERLTNLKISGVPAGEQLFTGLDPITGAFVPGVSVAYGVSTGPGDVFTILAADFRNGLWLSELPGVSGTLRIVANVDGPGGVDPTPASADIVLTNDLLGPVRWINSAGGDWNIPANWSTGAVPIKFQDVIIDAPGTYTITSSIGVLIDSLLVISGATLDINGGTFSITTANISPLSNAGTILIENGAVLSVAGQAASPLSAVNTGAIMIGSATTAGTLKLSSVTVENFDGTNYGTLTVTSLGKLDLLGGVTIDDGVFNNAGNIYVSATNAITNETGAVTVGSGKNQLTNTGSITVGSNDLGAATAGELDLTSDKIENKLASTYGTLTVTSLGKLDLLGGVTIDDGVFNNAGNIYVSATNAITNEDGAVTVGSGRTSSPIPAASRLAATTSARRPPASWI